VANLRLLLQRRCQNNLLILMKILYNHWLGVISYNFIIIFLCSFATFINSFFVLWKSFLPRFSQLSWVTRRQFFTIFMYKSLIGM
jgi:hypothetical protein